MAKIVSFEKGNGLTELVVTDADGMKTISIKQKAKKNFAWMFLLFLIVDIAVGVAAFSFVNNASTIAQVLYWTQCFGLIGLWIYANFFYKGKDRLTSKRS